MSNLEKTEPKVFIIETLRFEDEERKLFEGNVISNILMLSDIECIYYYVRTKKEFKKVLGFFFASNYRYLHISCHGGEYQNSISTTLDEITFDELAKLLEGNFKNKRLFLSACSVVNQELAEKVIPTTNCYSIIGPKNKIAFRDAVIMWASFYHLMFDKGFIKMTRKQIIQSLQKVCDTFSEELNYYSISSSMSIKLKTVFPVVPKSNI